MGWIVYRHSDRSMIQGTKTYLQNIKIEEALDRLEELSRTGWNIRFVDTAEMTDAARTEAYLKEAAAPASFTHHAVRGVFGSNQYPEREFGVGVPALRIEAQANEDAGDVYPHWEGNSCITISEYLNRSESHRQFGTGISAITSEVPESLIEVARNNSQALEEMLTKTALC
jgi:hypothetical protein